MLAWCPPGVSVEASIILATVENNRWNTYKYVSSPVREATPGCTLRKGCPPPPNPSQAGSLPSPRLRWYRAADIVPALGPEPCRPALRRQPQDGRTEWPAHH